MTSDRPAPLRETSPAQSVFCTTHWTLVLSARGASEPARQALCELCEAYYEPVVAFLAREGRDPAAARDAAHEFFAYLLAGDPLADVRRGSGRFRSYLLGALKHFLSHRRAREHRLKRGGGAEVIRLETDTGTSPGLSLPDPHALSPEVAFDRAWATALLARALAALRKECEAAGKTEQFEQFKPWLIGEAPQVSQAELARSLGMEVEALKAGVHRLRKRFRQLVKLEITSTLSDPAGAEEEMRALFAALNY